MCSLQTGAGDQLAAVGEQAGADAGAVTATEKDATSFVGIAFSFAAFPYCSLSHAAATGHRAMHAGESNSQHPVAQHGHLSDADIDSCQKAGPKVRHTCAHMPQAH